MRLNWPREPPCRDNSNRQVINAAIGFGKLDHHAMHWTVCAERVEGWRNQKEIDLWKHREGTNGCEGCNPPHPWMDRWIRSYITCTVVYTSSRAVLLDIMQAADRLTCSLWSFRQLKKV